MNEVGDLIYVNYEKDLNMVISYGIEFKEFIQSLSNRPKNILVLEGHFMGETDFTTNCEYCISKDIEEFIEEDVYSYGDFSWIDFESVDGLQALECEEVAELFYIGKMWKVINKTYFEKLGNRFIYNAHDDGWCNNTFYNNISDFKEILSKVIVNKIYNIYKFKLNIMDDAITTRLCKLSMDGIAIDLLRLSIEEDNTIVIPIYQLGKYNNMDKVYELSRKVEVEVNFELKYDSIWKLVELNQ